MTGFEWIAPVGYAGLGVLVACWLVVSFMAPGPRRAVLEWLGACGMYVALLMLFSHLLVRARETDSLVGTVAFGFLVSFFGFGLLLCLGQILRSLRGSESSDASATN